PGLRGGRPGRAGGGRQGREQRERVARLGPEQRRRLAEAERLSRQLVDLIKQGRPAEAVALGRRALELREQVWGKDLPELAVSQGLLGLAYSNVSDFARAGPLLRRAVAGGRQRG